MSLRNLINDELFMIEYGNHTIHDINNMIYVDFCVYIDLIYNNKLKAIEDREAILKEK